MSNHETGKWMTYASTGMLLAVGTWLLVAKSKIKNAKEGVRRLQVKLQHSRFDEVVHVGIGDSVARGYGSSSQEGFIEKASRLIEKRIEKPVRFYNFGQDHLTSEGLIDVIQNQKVREKIQEAHLITINIGGNDLLKIAVSKGPLEAIRMFKTVQKQYRSNLEAIVESIRKLNPDALISINELYNPVSPAEAYYEASKPLLDLWNTGIYMAARKGGLCFVVPSSELFAGMPLKVWAYDEVHPNDFGYEVIAKKLVDLLLQE